MDYVTREICMKLQMSGGHANEAGHERWAQKLIEELKERNIYGV